MKIALLSFMLSAVLSAATAWQADSSDIRIRFSLAEGNIRNVLIPVPEEFQTAAKDIFAADDAGTQLPASPVWLGQRLVAVAVDGTEAKAGKDKQKDAQAIASLYLLPEKNPAPIPWEGKPVSFMRHLKSLTTRPHSADEMLRYFANLHLIPYPQSLAAPHTVKFKTAELKGFSEFGKKTELATVPVPPKHRDPFSRALTISTAILPVDKSVTVSFTADRRNVAWTLLLDASPVANWTTEGTALPEWLELRPGLHVLQLIAVQSIGEPLPVPRVRYARDKAAPSSPEPLKGLLPASMPLVIGIETKEHQGQEAVAAMIPKRAFVFAETAQHLSLFAVSPAAPPAITAFLDADGNPVPFADGTLFAADCFRPSVRIQLQGRTCTFAGRHLWQPPTAMNISARMTTPPYQDARRPMPVNITVDAPAHLPEALLRHLNITVSQFLEDGTRAAIGKPMPLDGTSLLLDIGLAPKARRLNISGRIGDARAFRDLTAALIAPDNAHTPLRAQGRQLFTERPRSQYATILTNDLQTQNVNKTDDAPTVTAVVDDFLMLSQAPGADLAPPPPMTLLTTSAPTGTSQDLALALALHRLLNAKPANACLLLNPKAFTDHDRLKLTAFASACSAHAIRPVAVILPPLPRIPNATARETALAIKSFTAGKGLPCLDLYTAALLEKTVTADWFTAQDTAISTISNNARKWLFDHLRQLP